MDFPYIALTVVYFIFSLVNVSDCGPHFASLRKKSKENDEWVNQHREGKDRDKPRFVSMDYRYYTLFTFALIPFHTVTKDNRFYIVRLLGYLADIVYGGFGFIVWTFLYLIKNLIEALNTVFIKLKNL